VGGGGSPRPDVLRQAWRLVRLRVHCVEHAGFGAGISPNRPLTFEWA
jgi:hypothetical protein